MCSLLSSPVMWIRRSCQINIPLTYGVQGNVEIHFWVNGIKLNSPTIPELYFTRVVFFQRYIFIFWMNGIMVSSETPPTIPELTRCCHILNVISSSPQLHSIFSHFIFQMLQNCLFRLFAAFQYFSLKSSFSCLSVL